MLCKKWKTNTNKHDHLLEDSEIVKREVFLICFV